MENMSKPVFLVTGAHGFIGAWVVKRLIEGGHTAVLIDQNPQPRRLQLIMDDEELGRATFVAGNITDPATLPEIIEKHGVNRIIHLAALQIPACRANPALGAMVNVVGSINVFEAAVKSAGQVKRVAYASSAAVFGRPVGDRAAVEEDASAPDSLYGAFKRCNEENARVYFNEKGISSIGLRPHTVYGVGRDFGMTSDPTKAMKAVVVGRSFLIRFSGSVDFQYAADTADAFIRSASSDLEGANVYNLHGETVSIQEVVQAIESSAKEILGDSATPHITIDGKPNSAPSRMDDSAIRRALGDLPVTSLKDGVHATIARFAELARRGPLDVSDLEV
jgi:nucleoside-diphosphate-sugar epimerase